MSPNTHACGSPGRAGRVRGCPWWRFWVGCLFVAGAAAWGAPPGADARHHWAFRHPEDPVLPRVRDRAWPRNGIDTLVLARLEDEGLAPGSPADARTLIRRMTFDLHGLPPAPDEVAAFEAEMAADRTVDGTGREASVRRLIERLLASPRYGERWGRHWLDVARYSDTKGYVYGREERRFVHAPAYRDWVIRAFNEDLPYDRFLMLQIAADRLVPAGSPDLAAMGFITGGRRFIGVTHDIIDDRIDVVTRGTLGLTVQCARCHDHKYDPIPTEDYYSLYGVFRASEDRLVPLTAVGDPELARRQKVLSETMARRREEAAARLRVRVGDYLAAQLELGKYPEEGFDQILSPEDLIPASVRRWRDYLLTTADPAHPLFGPWHALAGLTDREFEEGAAAVLSKLRDGGGLNPLVAAAFATAPGSRREVAARYGEAFAEAAKRPDAPGAEALKAFLEDPRSPTVVPDTGIVNNDQFFPFTAIEELWKMQGDVERRLLELGQPAALILADGEPGPDPRVFRRGSPSRLGDPVPRRFLGVLSGPEREPFRDGSGRLELARAIVRPDNPLTARVMVNRIWQHHFGSGLVRTPSDFGLRAEAPGQPELLDWLALRFMEDGWSVKAMHRLILASATYRQSPASPGTVAAGRAGRLASGGGDLARGGAAGPVRWGTALRRLDFEQLRDAMLAVSGELDGRSGGTPQDLLSGDNRRRTVYAFVDRQFLPGALRTFDFANPDIHVAVRHETTVPQQALFFLNGTFAAERARVLASRVAGLSPEARVRELHRRLYQRDPAAREVELGLRFVGAATTEDSQGPPPARETAWRYGTGAMDEAGTRLQGFTPLPHFTGLAWQGAAAWPGGESGWAQVTAGGGHPGNTRSHAVVRRWVASFDGVVEVGGRLRHEPEPGDGVRAFVVSSRLGTLKSARVHHSEADMSVARVEVRSGDTLDFVVDIGEVLNSDQYLWAPVVTRQSGPAGRWDAVAEFTGPAPEIRRLGPWEQYAQVLLLANEFAFVD